MKLNELIEQLTKLRDANPALGDLPITMEDTELGDMYPLTSKTLTAPIVAALC